jgi:hypothetical protein
LRESTELLPPPPEIRQAPQNALAAGTPNTLASGPPPMPSHAQTVAFLRYFQAFGRELKSLLKNPDCGRADMRDAVIEKVTQSVADRFMSTPDAVAALTSFPDRPYDQKVWLEKHLEQNIVAEISVLEHHRRTNRPMFPDFATEHAVELAREKNAPPADHLETINEALRRHYRRAA